MSLADARRQDPIESLPTWSMCLGGALAALGCLALAAPWVASTIVALVCGGSLIAAGVSQLGMTAATWTWRGFWLTLLCGALSSRAGSCSRATAAGTISSRCPSGTYAGSEAAGSA